MFDCTDPKSKLIVCNIIQRYEVNWQFSSSIYFGDSHVCQSKFLLFHLVVFLLENERPEVWNAQNFHVYALTSKNKILIFYPQILLSVMYDSQTHISYHVLVIPGIILLLSHSFMGVWRKLKPQRNKCVDNKLYVIFSFASFMISLCMIFAFYGLISNPNESKTSIKKFLFRYIDDVSGAEDILCYYINAWIWEIIAEYSIWACRDRNWVWLESCQQKFN